MTPSGTLARTPLAELIAVHARDPLPFAVATRRQAATRTRYARLTVQARTWAALRGQG